MLLNCIYEPQRKNKINNKRQNMSVKFGCKLESKSLKINY